MKFFYTYPSILSLTLISVLSFATQSTAFTPATPLMKDYTKTPAFISKTEKPSTMIILDSSGSMQNRAYRDENFSPTKGYYGYFDKISYYSYDTSNSYFVKCVGPAASTCSAANAPWSGNYLNWLTMRRIDVAKQVLTGGKVSTTAPDVLLPHPGVNRDYSKYYNDTQAVVDINGETRNMTPIHTGRTAYFRSGTSYQTLDLSTFNNPLRIKVDPADLVNGSVEGLIQKNGDDIRFGLTIFDTKDNDLHEDYQDMEYNGGEVEAYVGSTSSNVVNAINDTPANSWTPLAETVYTVAGVYAQDKNPAISSAADTLYGPRYGNDSYTPSPANDPFYFLDKNEYVHCSKPFVILITDGEPTMDTFIPSALRLAGSNSPFNNGAGYLENVSYWAHTTDLRPDLEGQQSLIFYNVFAFGSGQLLHDAAINGSFIDKDGNGLPNTVTAEAAAVLEDKEWDFDDNGVPDHYAAASDGEQLEKALSAALNDVLRSIASGTASSVISSSRRGEGAAFQAIFVPEYLDQSNHAVEWIGDLNAMFKDNHGNLREDTDQNSQLDFKIDRVARVVYLNNKPQVELYYDTDGDGQLELDEDLDGDRAAHLAAGLDACDHNEDLDYDGNLDVAEDLNGNRRLDTEDMAGDGDCRLDRDEDLNDNGVFDPGEDIDGDGHFDNIDEDYDNDCVLNTVPEDIDGDGNFDDINEDFDGDGLLNNGDPNFTPEDIDGDGHQDVAEDLDGDGNLDEIEDRDGDGVLDLVNEDLDGDGNLDVNEDLNGNGILDPGEDLDGDNQLDLVNEDLNGDGNLDVNEDVDGDRRLDTVNEDIDGDGNLDVAEYDTDGDGFLDIDEDLDSDGKLDQGEDINNNGILDPGEDLDGDGILDLNENLDGDGYFDIDEDLDGDGKLDQGEDLNCNGIIDGEDIDGDCRLDLKDEDIDGDGKLDYEEDVDQDGVCDVGEVTVDNTVDLLNMNFLWSAGKTLGMKSNVQALSRNIITAFDDNGDGQIQSSEAKAFTSNSAAAGSIMGVSNIHTYFNLPLNDPANATAPENAFDYNSDGDTTEDNTDLQMLIDYIAGVDDQAFRSREIWLDSNQDGTDDTQCTWRLGDIINSSPVTVGKPMENFDLLYNDDSYRLFAKKYLKRRQVLYVGSNDGMLRAINGGFYDKDEKKVWRHRNTNYNPYDALTTNDIEYVDSGPVLGDELWAYLPYNLLPHLQWLARKDYQHIYYVDKRARVADVKIFQPEGACATDINDTNCIHPEGWGTILIGGMGFGGGPIAVDSDADGDRDSNDAVLGSSYFVMDITDPESGPVLLGEFTFDDFSFSRSNPTIIQMKNSSSPNGMDWYITLGTGPTTLMGQSDQQGKVYIMKLNHNPVVNGLGSWIRSTAAVTAGENWFGELTENESFLSDIVSVDYELGEQAGSFMDDAIYFGSVSGGFLEIDNNQNGTFDTGETDFDQDGQWDTGWSGALYRIILNDDTDPSNWFFGTYDSTGTAQPAHAFVEIGAPITSAPSIAPDYKDNVWIYAGTGRYLDEEDDFDQDPQYMIGVMEPIRNATVNNQPVKEMTGESVDMADLLDVSTAIVYRGDTMSQSIVTGVAGVNNFQDLVDMIENDPGTSNYTSAYRGWKKEMLEGLTERIISSPLVYGGAVFFSSYAPNREVCAAGGNSWAYGVYYLTGTAYFKSIFGTDTNNTNNGEPQNLVFVPTGPGKGGGVVIDDPGGEGGSNVNIQSSSGAIKQVPMNTPIQTDSGKMFWKNEF